MDMRNALAAGRVSGRCVEDEVWLLGQPPLQTYLDYVSDMAVTDRKIARSRLVNEWRKANDHFGVLEDREAGEADKINIKPLDPSLRALARKVRADNRYRRAFDELPTRIVMVELDRLMVGQSHVNLNHARRLKLRLGKSPSLPDLFRFCQPLDRPEAPVEMRRAGSNRFFFWSPSSDFRFLETSVLTPEQFKGHESFGPIGGMIGVKVGYGSNFLSAIQSDNRLLLHNGHHRAYALRDLGIRYVPCIVQTVTRLDELRLVAGRAVSEEPGFYFKAKRPPLLRDFFNPKFRKVLRVARSMRLVEMKIEIKETELEEFEGADR